MVIVDRKDWPAGARSILSANLTRGGNELYLCGGGAEALVLKVYRQRRPGHRQALGTLSHRLFEGKRGVTPRERRETERLVLGLWEREGFDVFHPLDRPAPADIEAPVLWLEYRPGRSLAEILADPSFPRREKLELTERFARELARRQRRALELESSLLVQEHATVKHLWVAGDRLITFDFEGAYRDGYPPLEALCQELSGYLRSMFRSGGSQGEEPSEVELIRAFTRGHGDGRLLRELVRWGVAGRTPRRILKRWQDGRRRSIHSKTDVLRRLGATL